jgi:predicted O-linked N-acetylglucosamine transferase (SPINDLY family)
MPTRDVPPATVHSARLPAQADGAGPALTVPQTMQLAAAAYARGDWHAAERLCRAVLDQDADHFDALHLAGIVAARSGRAHDAVDLLQRAAAVGADNALVHYHRGVALGDLERHAEALESYDRAVALAPGNARAWNNRGIALACLARHDEALESYARALSVRPDYAQAFNNRGVALRDLGRHAEALESYESALRLKPDYVEAISNRGAALHAQRRHGEALDEYARALRLAPDYAEAWNNRGVALAALRRHAEALAAYDRALAFKPRYAEAWNNRGVSLTALDRHAEALSSYARALEAKPDYDFLYGRWLHARMKVCDWEGIGDDIATLESKIRRREKATPPFPLLALTDSPAVERMAAETWVAHKHAARLALPRIPRRDGQERASDRIRLGYFSADFREHACARLFAGLLEQHDRSRFEVTAFSFGPESDDAMRRRLSQGVDRFIDVRDRSDLDVAVLARELGIDIAVDLMGFTREARTDIFALRAAPIQVNFLGYPGTMGAPFIDYLVADATLVPPQSRQHYTEAIAYLPESYQPNDDRRQTSERAFSRDELGLAQADFVFCCFNNNYKITPATFDSWMRILREVDGSTLWLLADNEVATRNLRREASRRHVNPGRLVFAPLMAPAEHLARHRAADLFLDTLPYNAHTTASDALWAGLPVLTCRGETFAGRVAASLLAAVRLPDLVTATPEAYESLAIELATRPEKLKRMREQLAVSRHAVPLFDTTSFARHLEAAYSAMLERDRAGLPPDTIHVER